MTTTTTSTPTLSEPVYPCDKGFGDGVGRGWHHFQGDYAGNAYCIFCGKSGAPPGRSWTWTAPQPGMYDVIWCAEPVNPGAPTVAGVQAAVPLRGVASWWEDRR